MSPAEHRNVRNMAIAYWLMSVASFCFGYYLGGGWQ